MAECKHLKCTAKTFCPSAMQVGSDDSHAKGIVTWRFLNVETGKWRTALVGYKENARDAGIAFNFCPWCGFDYRTKIKALERKE